MTDEPTLEAVQAIVIGIAGLHRTPADAGPDTPLAAGGFWLDSVHMLETVIACEDAFGVELDPELDLTHRNLETVRTLCALIRSKRMG